MFGSMCLIYNEWHICFRGVIDLACVCTNDTRVCYGFGVLYACVCVIVVAFGCVFVMDMVWAYVCVTGVVCAVPLCVIVYVCVYINRTISRPV